MSTAIEAAPETLRRQLADTPANTDILPAVIRDKKRRRIVDISPSGQPYIPERQAIQAGVPFMLSFESLIREIDVQNNSGATLYYSYSGNVSPSSFQILTGATWVDTVRVDTIFLYSVAGTILNPTQTDGNGVVVMVKL